ncbi:MAG: hypothetical protein K2L69_09255 [Muribaculaceae bacterium]|nr:hypothetical protein [Muribaculaceae bacterium]MDE5934810.1 hypothetical protein [Muribaculaceae bacterium]MDE6093997.1 hypothetical protein [Muribaculaceae bacterium]MDE6344912.1 hypothetical protein [Muribaculaceae bacterium]
MKAKIIAFLFSLIAIAPLSAQHYRGFFDAYGMLRVKSAPSNYHIPTGDYGWRVWGAGATTSHGIQLNKLFIGLGAGYYSTADNHSIPIFADARWDFFGTRGVNFFAGIKLGYNKCIYSPTPWGVGQYDEKNTSSFYFQPSVGMRIRTGHSHGLNISLNYIPLRQQIVERNNEINNDDHSWTPIGYYTKGYIALGVGFDF